MFVTLEGIEGSGKSTQLALLREHFAAKGESPLFTRQPGGCELGTELRAILLKPGQVIAPRAELFLYLADRAQHVELTLRPALAEGKTVICDRYADSTLAYQGYGRGLNVEELKSLNSAAVNGLWPDMTLLLDLKPQTGLGRARSRNRQSGLAQSEGRFEELELEFHHKVREGYLKLAASEPSRFKIIDASLMPQEVFREILAVTGF